jgi:hypothetical protein
LHDAGQDQDGERDRIGRVLVAQHRPRRGHERGPEEQRRHEQQPPYDRERQDLRPHPALRQHDDDRRETGGGQDHEADETVRQRLAEQDRGVAHRRAEVDRRQAGRSFAVHRFDGVEQEQQDGAQRQRVERVDRERPRGDDELRAPDPLGVVGVQDRLQQDERDE